MEVNYVVFKNPELPQAGSGLYQAQLVNANGISRGFCLAGPSDVPQ